MPDEITADRVAAMAATSRVLLTPDACARVARAVSPTSARFAAEGLAIAFEVEPATFAAVARRQIKGAR